MKLYATPLSHFSRKVRILLDALGLDFELAWIGEVSQRDQARFANNPLMGVPVLEDGDHWLLDSDNIAGYIVRSYDSSDRFDVLTSDSNRLNARAVMNGAMDKDVLRLLAARTGVSVAEYDYFDKALAVITSSLAWLEANNAIFDSKNPGYLEFHLVCMVGHLRHYDSVPLPYPGLEEIVVQTAHIDFVRRSVPAI